MYNLSFWISQLFTILTWQKKCLRFMILVMIYTCQDKFPTDAEKKKSYCTFSTTARNFSLNALRTYIMKSTQYKKLAPNALRFTYWNLKSCKPQKTKQKHQNARFIDENQKAKSLMFFVLSFMWFARFQIFNM